MKLLTSHGVGVQPATRGRLGTVTHVNKAGYHFLNLHNEGLKKISGW